MNDDDDELRHDLVLPPSMTAFRKMSLRVKETTVHTPSLAVGFANCGRESGRGGADHHYCRRG